MKTKKRILITAGPTIEPLDPIRFISNRSTGLIGYELARAARKRRYKVTLISGPTYLKAPQGVKVLRIESALELLKKVRQELKESDILIMSSAVSDFRPANFFKNKIKSKKSLNLKLSRTPDILSSISKREKKGKVIAGFSLETEGLLKSSFGKLKEKGLDLIVANKLDGHNEPFGKGEKTVYILDKFGRITKLKNMPKYRIARAILDSVEELCYTPK